MRENFCQFIYIKISFAETHTEDFYLGEDFDWSKLENKEPKVLGKIDLTKLNK